MIYGYSRVSTLKQRKDGNSLEEQKQELISAGVPAENIIAEAYTGTKSTRPEFTKLIDNLKDGDTLVVCKIDRFARSVLDGVTIIKELVDRNVTVRVLNMGITVDNKPVNKAMVTMLLMFAELERDLIVERTQGGKAIARGNGKRVDGRPNKFSRTQVNHALELLNDHSYNEVSNMTGISVSTLTRAKRKQAGN